MDARPVEQEADSVESLRQKLEESQRLARMLDLQVHVLERERQKLSAVVGHGDVGFLVVDPSLRVVWTNEYLTRQLRTAADSPSFVGSVCHRVLCRRDVVCEGCPATAAFESESTAHRELNLDVDGNPRVVYVTAIPVLSPKGTVEQLMVMVQDVSDLEVLSRSERRVRESESRLRLIVEQMPAVMWSTDRDLRFTSCVGSALKNLGLEPNELVGQTLFEFFGTDEPSFPPIAAHVRAVSGISVTFGMSWNRREFDTYLEPLFGPQREIIGSVGLALDVTERQAAEAAREQSEARKHAILETSLDAIVIMDHDGRVVEFNPAAEKTFGYERSEVIGRFLAELIIPPHLRAAHRDGLSGILTADASDVVGRRIESVAMRKDGSELPVELAITRIPLEGPPTFAGHIRDLTDRKQAEAELRERDEQLRQAQRMEAIGTLAGGVAHDFNNILTAILGYTGLLKRLDTQIESIEKAADVMEKAAKRGAVLTQQLLGFARKGKNESTAIDLAVVVDEVAELLGRTIEKNIVIRRTGKPSSVVVIGDPGQLHQVVLNLGVNSRDAMPDGGEIVFDTSIVTLTEDDCRRQPGTSPGDHVRLAVRDSGCGIPQSVRGRIFEPFFTTKELGKGTGMGLAMVYGIVRNHGGAIGVASEVGRGTTIEILLPHAAAATPAESAHRSGDAVGGTGRILVVDDEDGVREVAADLLSCLGYDVTTAPSGADAVAEYRRSGHEIDLVLLDLAMPGMDGRDCFRALKSINQDVKAVLCTGYGFNVAAQQLLDEGMVGIVSKPYSIEQLSDAIAQALHGTQR